ncbi:hypothetical protein E7T09_07045 [Deinococcus sp. KSM4-11]|uniref:DUF6174 domain-containing protein n=1 Tax=Deinococcus sp. KSM4-11 TaxID=2568654 RepID=UPI0010A34016|nr:DUF6174 domain-containing protein [Deinococcus sp. KSM4-11]THF88919.1 hypothetical protein E7T09_07045 [Deinococcus sp. KSM4-11]
MRPYLPLIVCAALGLAGCGLPTSAKCVAGYVRSDTVALTRDLNAARVRWQAAGTANYTYVMQYTGFAPVQLLTVTIQAGQVTAVIPDGIQSLGTVEDMFARVAQQIDGVKTTDCLTVSATYDPADGHPSSLAWAIEQQAIADGFGGWRLTGFTPQP